MREKRAHVNRAEKAWREENRQLLWSQSFGEKRNEELTWRGYPVALSFALTESNRMK